MSFHPRSGIRRGSHSRDHMSRAVCGNRGVDEPRDVLRFSQLFGGDVVAGFRDAGAEPYKEAAHAAGARGEKRGAGRVEGKWILNPKH